MSTGDYTTKIAKHLNYVKNRLKHLDENLKNAFNMIINAFKTAIQLRGAKTNKQTNCVKLNKILTGTLDDRGLNLALNRFEHITKRRINESFQQITELKNENPRTELLSRKSLNDLFKHLNNLTIKTGDTIYMFRRVKTKILEWPAYKNELETSSNDYCHKMIKDTFPEQLLRLVQLNDDFRYFREKLLDLTMRPKIQRTYRSKQDSRKSFSCETPSGRFSGESSNSDSHTSRRNCPIAVSKRSNVSHNKMSQRQTRKFKSPLSTIMEESLRSDEDELRKKTEPSPKISSVGSRSKKMHYSTSQNTLLPRRSTILDSIRRTVRSQ